MKLVWLACYSFCCVAQFLTGLPELQLVQVVQGWGPRLYMVDVELPSLKNPEAWEKMGKYRIPIQQKQKVRMFNEEKILDVKAKSKEGYK